MEGGRTFLLKKRNEECKEKEWAETRMEDTTRGTDIRRCGETIWDTVDDEILGRVRGETAGYGNRKRVKKGGYGKCSLETLSTLHADGHRFGKTKWRTVAKGRKEEGRKKKGKSGWWARGSRFTQNRFPLCLTAPAPLLPHATASVPFPLLSPLSLFLSFSLSFTLSKLCSQFTSDQVSALRFYANPMPMSCHRRGKPLPLRRTGTEGDFIFRGPCHSFPSRSVSR